MAPLSRSWTPPSQTVDTPPRGPSSPRSSGPGRCTVKIRKLIIFVNYNYRLTIYYYGHDILIRYGYVIVLAAALGGGIFESRGSQKINGRVSYYR